MSSKRSAAFRWVALILPVTLLGLAAEIGHYAGRVPSAFVELFSLSFEHNVPTWYATCLLFACGERLLRIGRRAADAGAPFARHWSVLGVVFVYMSLDEAIEIHEYLGALVPGRGLLHFSWVIPASIGVAALGLAYARFLRHLAPIARRRFVIAGIVYVTGALLMELPLGLWTERHGDDNLGYALIDFVEESLELLGAGGFLLALEAYARDPR